MTRQRHLADLAEQLRTIAARLERADYSDGHQLYVSLHLQVRQEVGDDELRCDLVTELGDALYGGRGKKVYHPGSLTVLPDGEWVADYFPGVQVNAYTGGLVCGDRTVFWPDHEAISAECTLPLGHPGGHRDETGTDLEWSRDGDDPCAAGCTDPERHAEGGHDA